MSKGRVSLSYSLAWIVFVVMFLVFFFQVANGAKLRDVLDFASTPYPTAISGGQQGQDNEQVSNNTNSIVLHVAPTTQPIAPTPQPTATPAPTVTPQPTATQQPTVTPVWPYMVGTSEALQRRIVALENAPAPQGEVVGFVHYGTAGVTLLIGVIVWGLVWVVGKDNTSHALLPQNATKQTVTPQSVTVTQHNTPVADNNSPVTIDGWAVARKNTRQKIANKHQRGALILLFPDPAPYEFTALQKRQLQELSGLGVSKRDLMSALWGRGGSLSKPALDKALEDE